MYLANFDPKKKEKLHNRTDNIGQLPTLRWWSTTRMFFKGIIQDFVMNWLLFQGFKRKPNDLKKLAKAVKYAQY